MKWPDDLADWPMADVSRKVLCRPHRWHVQDAGTGDTILLIHGAGGATQSWRGIFPLLAQTHRVIAIDLPGQGFTEIGARGRCGLRHMAEDIAALMESGKHPTESNHWPFGWSGDRVAAGIDGAMRSCHRDQCCFVKFPWHGGMAVPHHGKGAGDQSAFCQTV